jgi:hypothetical protein
LPKELAEYLRPTPSSPTDGIVLAKSREIVGSRTAALDKARAIYDWIVDNTFRRAKTRGCDLDNVAFMLQSAIWAANAPTSTLCMSGSRGQPGAGARLRHPRCGLGRVEVAREIERNYEGTALPRRGVYRKQRMVAG